MRRILIAAIAVLLSAGLAAPAQADTPATGDDILSGETLSPGRGITSANGTYSLVYQDDGNLVLYKNSSLSDRTTLWASTTNGQDAGLTALQADGNFVVYGGARPVWESGTRGSNLRLVVQNDGNVVIYGPGNTYVWDTATNEPAPAPPDEPNLLRAGQWKKVLWGWGSYTANYSAGVWPVNPAQSLEAEFECYRGYWPFGPVGKGKLPGVVSHVVAGYGDCWFRASVDARFQLTPVLR